ncbi:hypothetical protein PENSPDRAFT_759891 [Peniophora sp. CONT]|nr:hypothetical protein PENSPDRAFT_759891 [Peniophora sp. CONT]
MGDSIVLWRMCIVWNRSRPIVAFAMVLLLAALGVNIANIASVVFDPRDISVNNGLTDLEPIPVYDESSVGLAAAFMSLMSNLCATFLVGFKAWSHRRQLSEHACFNKRRTLAERVMQLLVESSLIYTSIWVLYCISFFRKISVYTVMFTAPGVTWFRVTAVDHLDAAMAQITSIYPLLVFGLLALDKIHYARGPRFLSHDGDQPRIHLAPATGDVHVERPSAFGTESAHVALHHNATRESIARMNGDGKNERAMAAPK